MTKINTLFLQILFSIIIIFSSIETLYSATMEMVESIELSSNFKNINIGETVQFTANPSDSEIKKVVLTYSLGKNIEYSVIDKEFPFTWNIIFPENTSGNYKIRAYYESYNKKQRSFLVNSSNILEVNVTPVNAIDSMVLLSDNSEIRMLIGDSYQLIVEGEYSGVNHIISGNSNTKFVSNNEDSIFVSSDGEVKALAKGEAKITITHKNLSISKKVKAYELDNDASSKGGGLNLFFLMFLSAFLFISLFFRKIKKAN